LKHFSANFSHFATAFIFLWLLSLHQGKESNNMIFIKKQEQKILMQTILPAWSLPAGS
jgi:hypothetical protein